jgi:hypothetical protein
MESCGEQTKEAQTNTVPLNNAVQKKRRKKTKIPPKLPCPCKNCVPFGTLWEGNRKMLFYNNSSKRRDQITEGKKNEKKTARQRDAAIVSKCELTSGESFRDVANNEEEENDEKHLRIKFVNNKQL